jgi:hypothetical protein
LIRKSSDRREQRTDRRPERVTDLRIVLDHRHDAARLRKGARIRQGKLAERHNRPGRAVRALSGRRLSVAGAVALVAGLSGTAGATGIEIDGGNASAVRVCS